MSSALLKAVNDFVSKELTDLLELEAGELKMDSPIEDLGMDSIKMSRFLAAVNAKFNLELPVTALLDFTSVDNFTQFLVEHHRIKVQAALGNK